MGLDQHFALDDHDFSTRRGRHRQPFAIADLPHNCLAFQALQSDPCHDRAERGTKENDYDDFHHR